MDNPVIARSAFCLVHVPDLVRHGSKPRRELVKDPALGDLLVGRPARSNSLTIVAPQRVQVPHVEVKTTACTPSLTSLAAISAP